MMNPIVFEASQNTNAKLPAVYDAAKKSLAECVRLDECKAWSDKAQALASYAKQAGDDALEKYAMKIRVRAVRRCGELLNQVESAQGERTDKLSGGAPIKSRKQAAKDAGLSHDQQHNAQRVANIPEPEFDAAVDGDEPATVTALAERGRKKKAKPAFTDAQVKGAKAAVSLNRILCDLEVFDEKYDWPDLININSALKSRAKKCATLLLEVSKCTQTKN